MVGPPDEVPSRVRVSSGSPFEPRIGFSRAVRVGDRVLVSGTGPVWEDGSCDPDPGAQTRRCFQIVIAALEGAGSRREDIVRTRMLITAEANADAIGAVHADVLGDIAPAATLIVVAGLLDSRWLVEIEAEAVITPPP